MNIAEMDKALTEMEKVRAELKSLDYNNPKYDEMEEMLHDLEDDFQEDYGSHLEKILQEIHDKYCPESDVLLPIAYMGNGVPVELEEHPNKAAKITIIASPLRVVLSIAPDTHQVVWSVEGN